jgi:predicted hydrolase (HD superfamily)
VINGAAELGVDLDEHITFVIESMKERSADLGLSGS